MERDAPGYFQTTVENIPPNCKYIYQFGSPDASSTNRRPDPASRFQPDGVHGPSQIVDLDGFSWSDGDFAAPPLENSIFYELHIGASTPAGTLDSLMELLPYLSRLGVTTVELMPVAQFPGSRNWGYDGVYPYAVQNTYGGPLALQRFVDAAHRSGLAVALDVVYNHLGPEGNYLANFGPYYTARYKSPWGEAINFDGAHSEPVRRFFVDNAIYWFEKYHIDVLRLDAVHGIFDFGARHFLAELQENVGQAEKRLGRRLILVAESDLNDARILQDPAIGGFGIKGQWSDDFHHSVHTLLTGETQGYYSDFGKLMDLVDTLRNGWRYRGQYSAFRKRRHGNSAKGISRSRLLGYSQNHDQVGNRAFGERLSKLVGLEALKLAAGITLLSPFVPLLFMGEEYGEEAPFLYFTDHSDVSLAQAVREGRRSEFAEFGWRPDFPDPQDSSTFERSKLHWTLNEPTHQALRQFYQVVLRLRKEFRLGECSDWVIDEHERRETLTLAATLRDRKFAVIFNFGAETSGELPRTATKSPWRVVLHSADSQWLGPGVSLASRLLSENSLVLPSQSFAILTQPVPQETLNE
jgi:maltooligosyltrehalose trehalohydrolase